MSDKVPKITNHERHTPNCAFSSFLVRVDIISSLYQREKYRKKGLMIKIPKKRGNYSIIQQICNSTMPLSDSRQGRDRRFDVCNLTLVIKMIANIHYNFRWISSIHDCSTIALWIFNNLVQLGMDYGHPLLNHEGKKNWWWEQLRHLWYVKQESHIFIRHVYFKCISRLPTHLVS